MAIRFDAAADRLLRTSDMLNYNATYTFAGWFYLSVDTNDFAVMFSLNDDAVATVRDNLATNNDGTTLRVSLHNGVTAQGVTGSNLSTATWYHIAMVRANATSCTAYLNGVLNITNTLDCSGRVANTRMEVGAIDSRNEFPLNGRCAGLKAWTAPLSAGELALEMSGVCPVRLNDLYAWWPCLSNATRAQDYSGNGRHWTEAGTLTNEDPPPGLNLNPNCGMQGTMRGLWGT